MNTRKFSRLITVDRLPSRVSRWFILTLVLIAAVESRAANAVDPTPLLIQGSSSVGNLADRLIESFIEREEIAVADYRSCDSDFVAVSLRQGKCHVGLVVESLAASTTKKLDDHVTVFPMAHQVIGVVVNQQASTQSVAAEDLQRIFSGEITSWSKVPRSTGSLRIELFSPLLTSTESYIFQHRCMASREFSLELRDSSSEPPRQKHFAEGVLGAVAKQVGAIGFVQYGAGTILDKRVRLLKIGWSKQENPVSPTPIAIADGRYPITDRLVLYLHPDAPPAARKFCEFAVGGEGAKVVRQFSLWPEYELEQERAKRRLGEAMSGKGQLISFSGVRDREKLARDLGLNFTEAREAVQMRSRTKASPTDATREFQSGGSELFISEENARKIEEQLVRSEKQFILGKSTLGIIANAQRKLTSLSFEELKQIASGEIKNWPEAEGMGPPIRGYALHATHPVMPIYFEQLVKRKVAEREGAGLLLNSRIDNQQVIQAVVQDPTGIGFVDLSQLPPLDGSVVLVGITTADGRIAQPAVGMVPEGYPLVKPLTLFVSPKAGDAAKRFADWLEQNTCEDVLARHHLMPPNGIQTAKTKELIASDKLEDPVEAAVELASATTESSPETAPIPAAEATAESVPMAEAATEVKPEQVVEPMESSAASPEQSIETPGEQEATEPTDATEPIVVASREPANSSEADGVPESLADLLEPASESNLPEGVIDTEATEIDWASTTLLALAILAGTAVLAVVVRLQWLKMRRKQWAKDNPLTLAE